MDRQGQDAVLVEPIRRADLANMLRELCGAVVKPEPEPVAAPRKSWEISYAFLQAVEDPSEEGPEAEVKDEVKRQFVADQSAELARADGQAQLAAAATRLAEALDRRQL